MDNAHLIPLAEYAERQGKAPVTVRQKAARGQLPGAVKIGRDWLIPADAPYDDARIKHGIYKSIRETKKTAP